MVRPLGFHCVAVTDKFEIKPQTIVVAAFTCVFGQAYMDNSRDIELTFLFFHNFHMSYKD